MGLWDKEVVEFEDSMDEVEAKLSFGVELFQLVEMLPKRHEVSSVGFSLKRVLGHSVDWDKLEVKGIDETNVPVLHVVCKGRSGDSCKVE